MSYQPVVIDRFGGLNLPEDPEQVGFGQALDMTNVDLDRRGRLRTRDGYRHISTTGSFYNNIAAAHHTSGHHVLVGRSDDVDVLDQFGNVVATDTNGGLSSVATINNATYIASGFLPGIRKYDGVTTISAPAGLTLAPSRFLAVQQPDNRLVAFDAAGPVYFSVPDDPETLNVGTDFVDISPGDGEAYTGVATWLNLLFVFKETKFAVFTGNTVDSVGGTVFNYRMVDTGVGVPLNVGAPSPVAVGPDGVYFGNQLGVWRTTGGPAQLVSGDIDSVFRGTTGAEFTGLTAGTSLVPRAMTFLRQRLYVVMQNSFTGAPVNAMYVFDLDLGQWLRWNLPALDITSAQPGSDVPAVWFTSVNHVELLGGVDDAGAAIPWSYSTGYSDLDSPEQKVIRQSAVWGSGTVTLKIASDHDALPAGNQMALGTAPAVRETLDRHAARGRFFRLGLSGSGPATVNRIVLYMRDARGAGER